MTIDQQRFLRELHGDFSEADAELRANRIKLGLVVAMLVVLIILSIFLVDANAAPSSDPYAGSPIVITATPGGTTQWEAETVDKGGGGVAWFYPAALAAPAACTPANACSCTQAFRTDGLLVCGASLPSPFITYTGPGSWYQYTIKVNAVGNFSVELFAAIGDLVCCGKAAYHLEVDGAPVLDYVTCTPAAVADLTTCAVASIPVKPTIDASWSKMEWTGKSPMFPLTPGTHKLRIVVDVGWFNWDAIRMKYAAGIVWQWGPTWQVFP